MTASRRAKAPSRTGRGTVSRADALRAYLALGAEGVAGPAKALGFTWTRPAPAPAPEPRTAVAGEMPRGDPQPLPKLVAPLAPLACWRPVRARRPETLEVGETVEDARSREPLRAEELRASGSPPPAPPIVSEPRLRRRLDAELRTPRPSADLDVDALVAQLARGQSTRELPRRLGLTQARLALVLDPSPRLTPFLEDQLALALALIERLGEGQVRRLPPPRGRRGAGVPDVVGDEIVLALTDLGFYGQPDDRDRWVRFGRQLRSAGARLRALVPCPAWRWRGPGARLWRAIDWSAPEGPGRRLRPKPLLGAPLAEAAEVLLRLLAPAVRVEPGLLRAVRRLLGESADLGTEADVWNHVDVDGGSSRTLEIDPRRRPALAGELLSGSWGMELVAEVAKTILGWHRHRPDLVWASEVAHLRTCGVPDAALGAQRVAEAERVFARAAASAASSDPAGRRIAEALQAYWHRECGRAPARLSTDRRFGPALVRAVRILRETDPDAPLPTGVTPEMLAGAAAGLEVRHYGIWHAADRLCVRPEAEVETGSLVVTISARKQLLTVSDGRGLPVELTLGDAPAEMPCPEIGGTLALVTDEETVELEAWKQPSWAASVGRDGYGLWAGFEVGGVEQRLRWIPPGRFEMGSPETEEGRFGAEGPVHPVVLSEGFWMAEAPCTQALWEAVMAEPGSPAEPADNPSRFLSRERPVEQVSWEDCQRFLDRLGFLVRDLEVMLPTEAEWEYACRAGTATATWRGDLEILGTNNAPLLDEIAWYAGNSGVDVDLEEGAADSKRWPEKQFPHTRAGTREVGQKAANSWGLRDMLGNVNEWCWDWYESYSEKTARDPEGPDDGTGRVLRGGSWAFRAQYVRAAYRYGRGPGSRSDDLGFRLSRGPRDRGAVSPARGSAVSETVRRGTSRRARSRRERAWVDRLGWAVDGGLDGHGRWAAFEVKGVTHRLRWMYPGTFLMGSPEDEAGRWDDEGPRHEVTLTEGFWLGEVPCTQALWQVVTGENPSAFRSPRRPVEQVSWEDCQRFFEQLNRQVSGLGARLPTEAEWEYACRAGTEPATWAGDLEILGERNAPGLDPIAWYAGNSGVEFDLAEGVDSVDWKEKQYAHTQAGTREVGLKRPNPWGLHDMLGNVLEWCVDSWNVLSPYSGDCRVDPVGTDGTDRVIRGGSWADQAQYVRAADRFGDGPGLRLDSLGFRLSRGPQEMGQAEPDKIAEVPGPPAEGRGLA